jgi:hypothetical protein
MPLTISKTIRPNAVWQEMYLQIKKNQRVIITAEGLWSPEMRPATILWCGPDGIQNRLGGEEYLLPGTNLGSLIARVGSDNSMIPIGVYHDFFSPFEGPLFLAMNENPEYHNQAGAVQAQIIIFNL